MVGWERIQNMLTKKEMMYEEKRKHEQNGMGMDGITSRRRRSELGLNASKQG